MQTLEGVKLIKDIEQKFDVMSIKYKGVSVWPFLRIYLKESVTTKRENRASASNIGLVLKSLFVYNPLSIFKRHQVWVFTASDRRKCIGGKMVHRISGGITACSYRTLMIEKPVKGTGHYKRSAIEEEDIISESWLLMTFHALEVFARMAKPRLQNEDVLRRILGEYDLQFNYLRYVRILNAQRLAMRLLLKIASRPKLVTMECPYDSMGYLWAFHEKGIKVVEMQHGSLNGNHIAYNGKAYEPKMNPDCICVFGEEEYNYFTREEQQYAPEVRMTGLYMLEMADNYFKEDIFIEDRRAYQSVVVVSGQPVYEELLSHFIDQIAAEYNSLLFVYIPRRATENIKFQSKNARLVTNVNIYEYLKWADIHMTISSSTCLEAQYFHTPTIFYNYNHISENYLNGILKEENGAFFVTSAAEFGLAYKKICNTAFMFRELFAYGNKERIKHLISDYLS